MEKKSSRDVIYEFKKNKNNSKVIIFLHALALNKSIMNDIISFFFQHNYSTLNIELRGHGRSNKKKCEKRIYISECISDIIEILKIEKINEAIIIGHSLGAVIASYLVSKYPEKFKKLIICAPLFRSPLKDQIINVSFIKIFILIMTFFSCIFSKIINKDRYIELNKVSQKTSILFFKGINKCFLKDIVKVSNIIYSNDFDISDILINIKIKTLVIGGKNDFLVNNKILNKIKNLIPDSELKIFIGNHCMIYKNKDAWDYILSFIEGN